MKLIKCILIKLLGKYFDIKWYDFSFCDGSDRNNPIKIYGGHLLAGKRGAVQLKALFSEIGGSFEEH